MQQIRMKKFIPGRFVKNLGGKVIVFHDSVARFVSEESIKRAERDSTLIVEGVVEVTEESKFTLESLQKLYKEEGTWAKVAESLDMTVSKLSALRKSLE